MLDIKDEIKELYINDIGNKRLVLELYKSEEQKEPTYVLENQDIVFESMELNEELSSERNIRFGQCYSSRLTVDIFNLKDKFGNDVDFIGYKLNAYMYIEDERVLYPSNELYPSDDLLLCGYSPEETKIPLFKGFVASSVLSDRRDRRKIIAYDILHSKLQQDITSLYWEDLIQDKTIKYIREKILTHLNIPFEEKTLVSDELVLQRDIFVEKKNYKISARVALESILEFCGCLGHVDRNGIFRFITLTSVKYRYPNSQLFPSNTIFPGYTYGEPKKSIVIPNYISVKYGENKTSKITGVEIISNNNLIIERTIVSNENIYTIRGNCYMENILNTTSATEYFSNPLYNQIKDLEYFPTNVICMGMPFVEVGDYISFEVANNDKPSGTFITIPVLSRTLKGIQAMKDSFGARGTERRRQQTRV